MINKLEFNIDLCALPVFYENYLTSVSKDGQVLRIDIQNLSVKSVVDLNQYKHSPTNGFSVLGLRNSKLVVQLISLEKGIFLLVDLETGVVEKIETGERIYEAYFIEEKYIFFSCVNSIVLFNLELKAIQWQLPGYAAFCLYFKNMIITPGDEKLNYINSYSIEDGTVIWNKELSSIGEYEDLLGETCKGRIRDLALKGDDFIVLGIDGYHVLSLKAKTGEEIWRLKLTSVNPFYGLDKDENLIYIIDYQRFLKVKPDTGEIIQNNDFTDFHNRLGLDVVGFTHFAFSKEYIFTINPRKNLVIALSKLDGSLVWHERFDAFIPGKNPPVIYRDRLYVLTESGRLHVYDIEG